MPPPRDHTDRVPRDRRGRARHDRHTQLVVVVLALVAGLIAAALGTRPGSTARALGKTTASTAAAPPSKPRTVLIGHVSKWNKLDLLAMASVRTGGDSGAVMFVPTTTLVQVPSFDTQALLSIPRLGGTTLLHTAVSNALGVDFDDVVLVDDKQLTKLIAPAKKLEVKFGRAVQVDDAAGTLAFTAGNARLSAADATRLLIGKDSAGALEHLVTVQAVMQGWFNRLRDPAVAKATAKVSQSAKPLAALARADLDFDTLPVDVLSSGSVTRYELRQPDADELVRTSFPDSLLSKTRRARVEVLNGTGAISLTQAVAAKIVPAGGEIILTGNVPGFGVKRTQVVYYREADLPAARRLAAALGVGSVALGNVPIDVVDLTVVVGKDFKTKRS